MSSDVEEWLLGHSTGELFARPLQGDLTDCPECVTTPELPTDGYECDLYRCNCGASWVIDPGDNVIKYVRLSPKAGDVREFEIAE